MKVLGLTSVGASPNCIMYHMHLHMTRVKDVNPNVDVKFIEHHDRRKTMHLFYIWPIAHYQAAYDCSPSDLVTCALWNNDHYLTWNHILSFFMMI